MIAVACGQWIATRKFRAMETPAIYRRAARSIEDWIREDQHFTGNRVAESVLAFAPLFGNCSGLCYIFQGSASKIGQP
jgi:hypothetical protein